jgi:hypothetical protein
LVGVILPAQGGMINLSNRSSTALPSWRHSLSFG